ncbi:MAG TPA: heavy metal-binding domain-containing protein [Gemmata sp.]|nr:heavy metal-binding domain-containing protein [Gemmata sp.]
MSLPQSSPDGELVPPASIPLAAPIPSGKRAMPSIARIVQILIVRVRFFLVLLAVLLLVGYWPILRNFRDKMMQGTHPNDGGTVSPDTEYWCPMCPGVVSDWPSKCPVCNMTLVRRKKGEPVPLPDGVLARMQFSPYRIQLAGIRTVAVEYRPMRWEVVLVGPVQRSASGTGVEVCAEAFATDLPFLKVGQAIEASSDGMPGHLPFRGKIARIESETDPTERAILVGLQIEDPDRELRSGTLATARTEAPLTQLQWWQRAITEEWRNRMAAESLAHALGTPAVSATSARVHSLLEAAIRQAMLAEGLGVAVPCSAVIDHGSRKVAFVENGPGMFDAVEVVVGPRCRDFYPVLRGLQQGQRVAATGAFLIDAEMWLNHDLAATWFGATRSDTTHTHSQPVAPSSSQPDADRQQIAKQKICPVRGEPLDSMGGPVRVELEGKVVFVCCKGCINSLRKDPAKYLEKLK